MTGIQFLSWKGILSFPPHPAQCRDPPKFSILRIPLALLPCLLQHKLISDLHVVDCIWNVMAHAQKPDFVFRWNGWVHLNRQGRQFSWLLAAEGCASVIGMVVMLDTPCSEVVWRKYCLPTPFTSFPFTSPPVHHHVPSHFSWTLHLLWESGAWSLLPHFNLMTLKQRDNISFTFMIIPILMGFGDFDIAEIISLIFAFLVLMFTCSDQARRHELSRYIFEKQGVPYGFEWSGSGRNCVLTAAVTNMSHCFCSGRLMMKMKCFMEKQKSHFLNHL